MYNYEWDLETGGYVLNTSVKGVIKELRPVFFEELDFYNCKVNYGWNYPESEEPLMWCEGRGLYYNGELVAEISGGSLYTKPILKNVKTNINIRPVDIELMIEKNSGIMTGFVQKTLDFVYEVYNKYKTKVDLFYVAFSAGKDSVVMLDLVQRALPHDKFVVVFGNTTMEVSTTLQTVELSKAFWKDLEWYEAKAPFNADESWRKIGFPARKLRWCCAVHKTAPSVALLRDVCKKKRVDMSRPFKVMVFDGIRAEESDARATYSMVSEGSKHAVQNNCSPIFKWNTSELFIYMLQHKLPFNKLYRYGSHRVGCKLCPMASEWYECVINNNFPNEVSPLVDIIKSSISKDLQGDELEKYIDNGGWKSRVGGRELYIGDNKITEIVQEKVTKYVIKNGNYSWHKWMTPVGELVLLKDNQYNIQFRDISVNINVTVKDGSTVVEIPNLVRTKDSIRFMYLFRNALYKAAYCVNCRECVAECMFNAVDVTDGDINFNNCRHCGSCLDSNKGCVVARSLWITGGGNNMSKKNISRYQNFGFRKEWLDLFFELQDDFWSNELMGKYMFTGFKVWLKESGITDKNEITELGKCLLEYGSESPITWGVIFVNIAYESPIVNWYVKNTVVNTSYTNEELKALLNDDYSDNTKKNALSSLKETLRYSPIGELLEQGNCKMKGKVVTSIEKNVWSQPEPIVVLYMLYVFAEYEDGLFSFTLSDLFDDNDLRTGLSPKLLFGLEKEDIKPILQGLANDFNDFIKVDFNKGFMENIFLNSEKTPVDVLKLS